MKRFLFIVLAFAACRTPTNPPAPAPPKSPTSESQFQDIGTLGAWTMGRGINDQRLVVGAGSASQYGAYPIISRGGVIERLEMFPGVPDEQMTGWAFAINEQGLIAGITGTGGIWYLTLWDAAGRRTGGVPLPGQYEDRVVALNSNGDAIAVWSDVSLRPQGSVLKGGALQAVGNLSEIRSTEPTAINARAQVVGRSAVAYMPSEEASVPEMPADTVDAFLIQHPFVWNAGEIQDLGVFGKTTDCRRSAPCASGSALHINDYAYVVGYSEDATLTKRPFIWKDGTLTDLGVFPGKNAIARFITNGGQIAGDGDDGAFIWQNGVARSLGTLGGGYMEVTAMNSRGDVAGTGLTASGQQHAFVWTDGRLIDLGIPLAGACAAKPVSINENGDVLIAVAMECFKNLPDPRLTNFTYVRPQRAVLWRHP